MDDNGITLLQGVSSLDLETPVTIRVNPDTNAVIVEVAEA